jgi:hypothetical protein
MKYFGSALLVLLLSTTVLAKDKSNRKPVPGGIRADSDMYKRWEQMVRPQKFPLLPTVKNLKIDKTKTALNAQRYIFHMDVNSLDFKNEVFEDGYFYFVYKNKEQGNLLLAVQPKYRDCFDDLKKKFDQMQWVTFTTSTLMKLPVMVLEYPRQCLGSFKYTGSKLKNARGDFD